MYVHVLLGCLNNLLSDKPPSQKVEAVSLSQQTKERPLVYFEDEQADNIASCEELKQFGNEVGDEDESVDLNSLDQDELHPSSAKPSGRYDLRGSVKPPERSF